MLHGSHPFLSHPHSEPGLQPWLCPQEHELVSRHLLDGVEPADAGEVAVVDAAEAEVDAVTAVTAGVFIRSEPTVGREEGDGSRGGGWS